MKYKTRKLPIQRTEDVQFEVDCVPYNSRSKDNSHLPQTIAADGEDLMHSAPAVMTIHRLPVSERNQQPQQKNVTLGSSRFQRLTGQIHPKPHRGQSPAGISRLTLP